MDSMKVHLIAGTGGLHGGVTAADADELSTSFAGTGGFSGYYRLQTLLGLCLRAPNANTGAMLTTVACSTTDTAMQFYFNPYGPKFR